MYHIYLPIQRMAGRVNVRWSNTYSLVCCYDMTWPLISWCIVFLLFRYVLEICIHTRRVYNLYSAMLAHIPPHHRHANIKTSEQPLILTTTQQEKKRKKKKKKSILQATTSTPLCNNTMSPPSRPNDFGSDLWVRDSHSQTRVSNKQPFIIPLHGAKSNQKPSQLLTTRKCSGPHPAAASSPACKT